MVAGGGATEKTTIKKQKNRKKNPKTELGLAERRHEQLRKLIPHLVSSTSAAQSFLIHHDLTLLPSQSLSLDSLLSSISRSLSTLSSLLALPSPLPLASLMPSPCWFQRFLSAAADDYDPKWTFFFNLSKPSFTLLLRLLTPSLSSLSPLPPICALASSLFRLSHSASFAAVGRRFDLDPPTACRAFYTVCKAINENLSHLFEFKSDINRIIVGFGWISLPNCCGVLGVEKFEIEGEFPGENRSLLVQALVDSEGRFLDISAGWPSRISPANILQKSKLFSGVEESKEYLNGQPFELNDGNSIPQYVLGDSCFPLLPWLLTPYRKVDEENGLSSSQVAFNVVHRRGIELVGATFEKVRARWKLVSRKWKQRNVESFPFLIVTCCLLHNFLIKCSEVLPDENVKCSRGQEFTVFEGEEDETGKSIRDALALHLSRLTRVMALVSYAGWW